MPTIDAAPTIPRLMTKAEFQAAHKAAYEADKGKWRVTFPEYYGATTYMMISGEKVPGGRVAEYVVETYEMHLHYVKKALFKGDHVPAHVLAEYGL